MFFAGYLWDYISPRTFAKKPYQYWGTSSSTPHDHASRNRATFHSHPPCHPPPCHLWPRCRQDRTVSWEECTNDLDANVVFGFLSYLASQNLLKNIHFLQHENFDEVAGGARVVLILSCVDIIPCLRPRARRNVPQI